MHTFALSSFITPSVVVLLKPQPCLGKKKKKENSTGILGVFYLFGIVPLSARVCVCVCLRV